ncbi:MAG TPA: DUF4177 domain-containing protein [Clostridiaceae bacterium]|nr:DUF4177 domain-containing protein [Clostridiaceae bacterium]HHV99089.1 DUF4177 domain-containing protein [Clostridiaceae bacterium]
MDKWEYKTIEFKTKGFVGGLLDISAFNEALNNCGRDGWELVSCFDTNQSYGASRKVIAVFKRQKPV